jgi:hypothetical protein
MLVIITRSDDPSVDHVQSYLKGEFIRVNVDESDSWSFDYSDGSWSIANADRSIRIDEDTRCWMWKAFFEPTDGDSYRNAEVQYIVREVYAEIARRGSIRGNPPQFHSEFGKMAILDVARKYFNVPRTSVVFNHALPEIEDGVVKSLASANFDNQKVLFTTRVDTRQLKPTQNPWFAQNYIDAKSDVTTYIVGEKYFTFERIRTPGKTVDWRREQLSDLNRKAWVNLQLGPSDHEGLMSFKRELGLHWGRIDFVKDLDDNLWFLEFNANGQFGFLDEFDESGVISEIGSYLES